MKVINKVKFNNVAISFMQCKLPRARARARTHTHTRHGITLCSSYRKRSQRAVSCQCFSKSSECHELCFFFLFLSLFVSFAGDGQAPQSTLLPIRQCYSQQASAATSLGMLALGRVINTNVIISDFNVSNFLHSSAGSVPSAKTNKK